MLSVIAVPAVTPSPPPSARYDFIIQGGGEGGQRHQVLCGICVAIASSLSSPPPPKKTSIVKESEVHYDKINEWNPVPPLAGPIDGILCYTHRSR